MYCSNCGKEGNGTYCAECGGLMIDSNQEKKLDLTMEEAAEAGKDIQHDYQHGSRKRWLLDTAGKSRGCNK